jgi:hypothetical protein
LYRFYFYIQYLRSLEDLPYAEPEELGYWLVIILCWPHLPRWIQWGGQENIEEVNTPLKRADYINGVNLTTANFNSWKPLLKSRNFDLTEDLFNFLSVNGFRGPLRRAIETGVW